MSTLNKDKDGRKNAGPEAKQSVGSHEMQGAAQHLLLFLPANSAPAFGRWETRAQDSPY